MGPKKFLSIRQHEAKNKSKATIFRPIPSVKKRDNKISDDKKICMGNKVLNGTRPVISKSSCA